MSVETDMRPDHDIAFFISGQQCQQTSPASRIHPIDTDRDNGDRLSLLHYPIINRLLGDARSDML